MKKKVISDLIIIKTQHDSLHLRLKSGFCFCYGFSISNTTAQHIIAFKMLYFRLRIKKKSCSPNSKLSAPNEIFETIFRFISITTKDKQTNELFLILGVSNAYSGFLFHLFLCMYLYFKIAHAADKSHVYDRFGLDCCVTAQREREKKHCCLPVFFLDHKTSYHLKLMKKKIYL